MDQATLTAKFFSAVNKLAALSLAISYPTQASLPHIVNNAFKKLLAISLATEIDFAESKKFKDFLANPGAFAAAAPAAAAGGAAAPAAKEEAKKSSSEESDIGGGFSMFD